MDTGVVSFFELLVLVVAGGKSVVSVTNWWTDPVVLDACFEPVIEDHLWLHFLAAECPFSMMISHPSIHSQVSAGLGSGV